MPWGFALVSHSTWGPAAEGAFLCTRLGTDSGSRKKLRIISDRLALVYSIRLLFVYVAVLLLDLTCHFYFSLAKIILGISVSLADNFWSVFLLCVPVLRFFKFKFKLGFGCPERMFQYVQREKADIVREIVYKSVTLSRLSTNTQLPASPPLPL